MDDSFEEVHRDVETRADGRAWEDRPPEEKDSIMYAFRDLKLHVQVHTCMSASFGI